MEPDAHGAAAHGEVVDVVVVGAGLAGLVAARELTRAGREVVVLEAAERCGGRAYAVTTALGSRVDLGGQWIGHDHHRLVALADELGLRRYAMTTTFLPRILDGSRRVRPVSATFAVAAVALAVTQVLASRPLARVRRGRWGSVGVERWLTRVPGRARRLLEVSASIAWTTDLARMPVATMLATIRAQGGLVNLMGTEGAAQDALMVEGAGTIVERLAADLGPRVRTGSRVVSVDRDADSALVRTETTEVRARRVVLTPPPPTAARIAHDPPLPPARVRLQETTVMGSVYKAIAVYPEPFWRVRGGGELVLLDDPGCGVFDSTPPDGPGHLCLLIGGPEAVAVAALDPDERRARLLGRLARHLGPEALEPADWLEKAWHLDPYAGGGYVALPVLGADHVDAVLPADPVGPLHWAGTETASDHPGYLDGAIESGERVAREVLASLRS